MSESAAVPFARSIQIAKRDDALRLVWGWAYVCEENGQPVVDFSGQTIPERELQKAAHGFVTDSRTGGVLHERAAGRVVDSVFFSKEVQQALGIDLGRVGWFIGFEVLDDAAWAGVTDGTYTAFSIGGEADEVLCDAA